MGQGGRLSQGRAAARSARRGGLGRRFRGLWCSTALSDTGNGIFLVGATLIAIRTLDDPALVGLLLSLATVPWLVAAVPAGVVVDRLPAHRVIQAANLGRAGIMLAIGVMSATGHVYAVALAVAVFAAGVLQTFVDGAAEALVPEIVDSERLSDANGALSVSTRVFYQFLGPPIAGLAYVLWPPASSLLAAGACGVSTLCIAAVRRPWPHRRGRREKLDVLRGVRLVLRHRVLGAAIVISGLTSVANGVYLTAFAVHANSRTGLGLTSATYGLLTGLVGVGAAAGAYLTGRAERLFGEIAVMRLTRAGWAVLFLSPLVVSPWLMAPLMVLGSAFGGMWAVQAMNLRQLATAPGQRAQVLGVFRALSYGCTPLGTLAAGALQGVVSSQALLAGAAALALVTIFFLPTREAVKALRWGHARLFAHAPIDRVRVSRKILRGQVLSYPAATIRRMSSAHRHHAIDYIELAVTDLEQAKRFYTGAFGWQFNDYGPEYAGIRSPQDEAAEVGGLRRDEQVRAGGPFVLLYSTDLDKSVAAVTEAGGQVVNGPYEFPGGRRFHFTDPSGNELGVWAEA
ncbi:MFS transporter [Amycolatopsis nigrescens]|uniref:MFS transporter n=1 Tax=Amycolatopsis nigrescens TaxID=381445 RepID=UPI000374AE12|nr:MFS transporter [Amycolatopsis nigrescens]